MAVFGSNVKIFAITKCFDWFVGFRYTIKPLLTKIRSKPGSHLLAPSPVVWSTTISILSQIVMICGLD